MGYNVNRFEAEVDPNLICGICSSVLEDAVLTPCGHSFCSGCLSTWLDRPNCPGSCPECRTPVERNESRPIHSIRNLINSMEIHCAHRERGCAQMMKIDNMSSHSDDCEYGPTDCTACGVCFNRKDLPDHHLVCEAFNTILESDASYDQNQFSLDAEYSFSSMVEASVCDLSSRVTTLELQLKRVKMDLELADNKNKRLERELQLTKHEIQGKRFEFLENEHIMFDPDYKYGFTPNSISKLSCLIAKFLLQKPQYVDEGRVFTAIHRCYDNYGHCGTDFEHDVHMLLATAYASNWFEGTRKSCLHDWLDKLTTPYTYEKEYWLKSNKPKGRLPVK